MLLGTDSHAASHSGYEWWCYIYGGAWWLLWFIVIVTLTIYDCYFLLNRKIDGHDDGFIIMITIITIIVSLQTVPDTTQQLQLELQQYNDSIMILQCMIYFIAWWWWDDDVWLLI